MLSSSCQGPLKAARNSCSMPATCKVACVCARSALEGSTCRPCCTLQDLLDLLHFADLKQLTCASPLCPGLNR